MASRFYAVSRKRAGYYTESGELAIRRAKGEIRPGRLLYCKPLKAFFATDKGG
jgi:hypothetical protein